MRTKSARPKKSPLEGYKTYQPEVEGYGDSGQWRSAFRFRMSLDDANARSTKFSSFGSFASEGRIAGSLYVLFGDNAPIGWFARTMADKWAECKKVYRKLSIEFYPEMRDGEWHGDKEKFLDVQGAYTIIKDYYERKGVQV